MGTTRGASWPLQQSSGKLFPEKVTNYELIGNVYEPEEIADMLWTLFTE